MKIDMIDLIGMIYMIDMFETVSLMIPNIEN
jgi:hypothetical protein